MKQYSQIKQLIITKQPSCDEMFIRFRTLSDNKHENMYVLTNDHYKKLITELKHYAILAQRNSNKSFDVQHSHRKYPLDYTQTVVTIINLNHCLKQHNSLYLWFVQDAMQDFLNSFYNDITNSENI